MLDLKLLNLLNCVFWLGEGGGGGGSQGRVEAKRGALGAVVNIERIGLLQHPS